MLKQVSNEEWARRKEAEDMLAMAVSLTSRRDASAATDAAQVLLPACDHGSTRARQLAATLRQRCWKFAQARGGDAERWRDAWERTLRWMAHDDLVSYLEYVELDRDPQEKFWIPRRGRYDGRTGRFVGGLSEVARRLQQIEDGTLDELFVSLPPRTGKTGVSTMFLTHLIGRFPDTSNLYSSYSDTVTTAYYQGVLEIITDPVTYRWGEVFPECNVASKNAADTTLNLVRKRKYPTFTARSVVGTLNGACDCSGVLIADDLCSGYEEAISRQRMEKLDALVENDLLSRTKSTTRKVWIGTRWSTIDPIGVRIETLGDDPAFAAVRWAEVNIPALSENPKTGGEESNFAYPYGVGFSTADYQRTRAAFERRHDEASWLAQYQQQPIERQGSVFDPDELRYFSGDAPEGQRVVMAVDPAFGGSDFTAAPVCVDDGDSVWVVDAVFSDREKDKTMPLLVNAARRWGVQEIRFEANRTLQSYVEEFRKACRDAGVRVAVTSRPADSRQAKETRIMGAAPDIRERFVFVDKGERSPMYRSFMDNVFEFNEKGTAKHDDAPDSLAMAASMLFQSQRRQAMTFRRSF